MILHLVWETRRGKAFGRKSLTLDLLTCSSGTLKEAIVEISVQLLMLCQTQLPSEAAKFMGQNWLADTDNAGTKTDLSRSFIHCIVIWSRDLCVQCTHTTEQSLQSRLPQQNKNICETYEQLNDLLSFACDEDTHSLSLRIQHLVCLVVKCCGGAYFCV